MDRYRRRLSKARLTNVDGSWYVPTLAIDRITDSDIISQIILEKNFLGDEADPAFGQALQRSNEKIIHKQAKATFAISCYVKPPCLDQIVKLIKYAVERGSEVDHRLPFSKSELWGCGFDDEHADAFFSDQWHFIAPKIRLGAFVPSEFGPEVILPLQLNQEDGRSFPDTGAFGTVTEIYVQKGHQVEPAYSGRIVRKQFHSEKSKKIFLRELRNLCILSSARHDNIVQLLGAYIHNNTFNLIFPLASHGNLDQLFHSDSPLSWTIMKSEERIVMALSGLASGLVTMHEFTTENIRLIGCHRDLKPANILVDDERFLLADFGLSRIVDSQETSSSIAPNIAGDFLAPEHEDKDRDFTRNPIGRSSDIWAFGCVTLMLLVFWQDGRRGLDSLESQRRVEWPQYAHHCFHDYEKPNSGLERPLQKLASSQSVSVRGLLYLVKTILVLERDLRPKVTAVDAYIKCLIIYTQSRSIEEGFDRACMSDYIHVHLSRARFRGWRSAVEISDTQFPEFQECSLHQRYGDFKIVMGHLEELQKMLAGFSNDPINQGRKAFLPVKSHIDRLLETLDDEKRAIALTHTECIMMESDKLSWLQELQHLSEKTLDERTRSKVGIRRQILQPSRSERLHVDFTALEPRPHMQKLSNVRILSSEGPASDLALAEETHAFSRCQINPASTYNPRRALSRLQETANLLSTSGDNKLFRVLCCRGYYHQPAELRSGLLYELPRGPNGKLERIVTLREMIGNETTMWCLGDRFNLARGLATAMYELHSVAWLHRNVSASNIAFFSESSKDVVDPKEFYYVGFAQSRADRDLTDSDGPTGGLYDEEYYQHPEYLSQDQGYQMQHDYHALGMLLLEIGLWKLFPNAICDKTTSLKANSIARRQLVPQLGWMAGSHYRDAVMACLDGTLNDVSVVRQGQKVPLAFRAKVVDQLSSRHCRA